jgi:hypothetical protein
MFDSLNIYESLAVIVADSPQALVADLKAIKTPIKIISIVQVGLKSAAYITGDIRVVEKQPTNKKVK